MERATNKFICRFTAVEQSAKAMGKNLADMPLEEMEKLWDEAKEAEEQA